MIEQKTQMGQRNLQVPTPEEISDEDEKDYVKHIARTQEGSKQYSLCGEWAATKFTFQGIDHAYNNWRKGGRLTVCLNCLDELENFIKHEREEKVHPNYMQYSLKGS